MASKRVIYHHGISCALLQLMLWRKKKPTLGMVINDYAWQLINLMNIYNHLNTL